MNAVNRNGKGPHNFYTVIANRYRYRRPQR